MTDETPNARQVPKPAPPAPKPDRTYTQADLDAAVHAALREARDDYDNLKQRAAHADELEQRVTALDEERRAADVKAIRHRIAASHGISADDADLFITATDPDLIESHAAQLAGIGTTRLSRGNVAPREGRTPSRAEGQADYEMRAAVGALFGRDTSLT